MRTLDSTEARLAGQELTPSDDDSVPRSTGADSASLTRAARDSLASERVHGLLGAPCIGSSFGSAKRSVRSSA